MKTVSIVGAGLVGSLLATYLGKKGYEVNVYERRPDLRGAKISAGKSINMACSTRGWQALDKVGVGEEVRQAAIPMYGRTMHDEKGELSYQPYGIGDQAIYSISRGGLNKILMNFAENNANVKFHYNWKCIDVDLDNKVLKFNHTENGEELEVKSDLIFGADGAFSAVRGVMQKLNHFQYSQEYITHDYKELSINGAENGEFLMEKNSLHIWPRGQYMLIALPNPDGSFTCTLFLPFKGENSFEQLKTREEVDYFFKKVFPDAYEMMPDLLEQFFANPQSPLALIRCYPWNYKGNVGLIGDASHAIVPFYGQGMISGFEDCYVLDQLMDKHGDNWEVILDEFTEARKPNGDAIANLAMKNFLEMRDWVGDERFLLRKKLEKKLHLLVGDQFIPQYSMVTFSHMPYSEAWNKGNEQDALLDAIMNDIPDLDNMIKSPKGETLILDSFKKHSGELV